MRHHNNVRKLSLESNERRALIKGLACELIDNGKITTTFARAKELRPFVEKLVTHGKEGTIAKRRILIERLGSEEMAKKVIEVISPKNMKRAGGYTRITKLAPRKSDQAVTAVIEFVDQVTS